MLPSLAAIGGLGALGVLALLHLVIRDPDAALPGLLPLDLDYGGRLASLLSGSTAVALAIGLWRGKRIAWALSVTTFALALWIQFAFVHHPWGSAVSLALLVGLLVGRVRFDVRSPPTWGRLAVLSVAVVGGLALVLIAIGDRAASPVATAGALFGGLIASIAAVFGVDDGTSLRVLHQAAPVILWAAAGVVLAGRLLILLTAVGELNPAPDRPAEREAIASALAVVEREGRGALLPIQRSAHLSLFLSRSGGTVIAHARGGRMDIALGDPIGPASDVDAAVAEFLEEARRADHRVAVYQATAESRRALRRAGFGRIFRIGHEAVIELATFGLDGSRRANLRHTLTRFHRDGARTRLFPDGLDDVSLAAMGDQLAGIDAAWRRQAGPALGFTINSFRREDLPTSSLAVAMDRSGRAVAFVTFQPTGADGGYVVDLNRRLPGSVPGAVEACIAEAAIAMRDAGATRLSLGLAPVQGLDAHGGPFEERAIRIAADTIQRWYDVDGLAFFKAKFDPTWVPRYVAAHHRRDLPAVVVTLLRLHLSNRGTLLGVARNLGETMIPRPLRARGAR